MKKLIKTVLSISFIFYLLVLAIILFLGSRGDIWTDLSLWQYIKNSSNFVPFKSINAYINAILNGTMNIDIPLKNLFGNLILFLPLGIYLPYLIKKLNKLSSFLILMMILLFVVEVIQLITRKGSFDIDDFILNMFGALMGYGIWKIKFIQKLLR